MSKTNPLSVRLKRNQQTFVHALAKKYGVKDAHVIRWAVEGLKTYVKTSSKNPVAF